MATESQLTKIEALLRKAESSKFPAEAEAFTAKAEALMARWSIDSAMLRAESDANPLSHVQTFTVTVWKSAMQAAQSRLLEFLVYAYQCKAVYSIRTNLQHPETGTRRAGRVYSMWGMPEDLRAVELLYASLQIQAANEYRSADVVAERQAVCGTGRGAGGRAIRFKNSFMSGYATKVGNRLREIRQEQAAQTSSSTELVLFNQAAAVTQAFHLANPRLVKGSASSSGNGGAGYGLGVAAGGRARLGSEIGR